jgi:hypothetical protein
MIRVEDASADFVHAKAHGAVILSEPRGHPHGKRQYSAQDPQATRGRSRRLSATLIRPVGAGAGRARPSVAVRLGPFVGLCDAAP